MRWSRELSLITITSVLNFCWTSPSLVRTTLQWSLRWKTPTVSCGRLVPELPYLWNPWRTLTPSRSACSSSRPSSRSNSNSSEMPTHGFSHAADALQTSQGRIRWAKIVCFFLWIKIQTLECGIHLFTSFCNVTFWGEKKLFFLKNLVWEIIGVLTRKIFIFSWLLLPPSPSSHL